MSDALIKNTMKKTESDNEISSSGGSCTVENVAARTLSMFNERQTHADLSEHRQEAHQPRIPAEAVCGYNLSCVIFLCRR